MSAPCLLCDWPAADANVFGERVAHLHFNLAPHREGDAPRGGPALLAEGAPPVPRTEQEAVARRITEQMTLLR